MCKNNNNSTNDTIVLIMADIADKYTDDKRDFHTNICMLQEFLYEFNNKVVSAIYNEVSKKLKDVCNDNLVGPKKF